MQYKIFLSYSRKDNGGSSNYKGWVKNFKDSIEKIHENLFGENQIAIYFDQDSNRNMENWKFQQDEEISNSDVFIAFLSENYIRSKYCRHEWNHYINVAQQKSRGGQGIAFIYYKPIPGWEDPAAEEFLERYYLDKEAVEFINEHKTFFTDIQLHKDSKSVFNKNANFDLRRWNHTEPDYLLKIDLIRRVKELKITLTPNFADDNDWLAYRLKKISYDINLRLHRIQLARLAKTNIKKPDANFVGRWQQILEIHKAMKTNNKGVICSLNALGGMGKSALAVHYAHIHADSYASGGMWFTDCENIHSFAEVLYYTFKAIWKECVDDEKETYRLHPPQQYWQEGQPIDATGILNSLKDYCVKRCQWLREQLPMTTEASITPSLLIIMDNLVENEYLTQSVLKSIPPERWINIIVTTRLSKHTFVHENIRPLSDISFFTDTESNEVFRNYFRNRSDERDRKHFLSENYQTGLKRLINYIEGYPLFTALAAASLASNKYILPSELLEKISEEGLEVNELNVAADKTYSPGEKVYTKEQLHIKTLGGILKFSIIQVTNRFNAEDKNNQLTDLCSNILKYATFLHNEYINIQWIKEWIWRSQDRKIVSEEQFNKLYSIAIDLLEENQILKSKSTGDTEFYKLHLLVQSELLKQYHGKHSENSIMILKSIYYDSPFEFSTIRIIEKEKTISKHQVNILSILSNAFKFDIVSYLDARLIIAYIKDITNLKTFFSERSNMIIGQGLLPAIDKLFDAYSVNAEKKIHFLKMDESPQDIFEFKEFLETLNIHLLYSLVYFSSKTAEISKDYLKIIEHSMTVNFNGVKEITDRQKQIDTLEMDMQLRFISLQGNMLFDRFNTAMAKAQYYGEIEHDKNSAIDILSTEIISEIEILFTENPSLIQTESSLYHILNNAKAQRGSYLIAIGKVVEGQEDLIFGVETRLRFYLKSLPANFSKTRFNNVIHIAESYLTIQDYNKGAETYRIVLRYLSTLKKEIPNEVYQCYEWQILLKSSIAEVQAGMITAFEYCNTLKLLMCQFIDDFTEDIKFSLARQSDTPIISLISFSSIIVQKLYLEPKSKNEPFEESLVIAKGFIEKLRTFYYSVLYIINIEPIRWSLKINFTHKYLHLTNMADIKGEEQIAIGRELFLKLPIAEKQITESNIAESTTYLLFLMELLICTENKNFINYEIVKKEFLDGISIYGNIVMNINASGFYEKALNNMTWFRDTMLVDESKDYLISIVNKNLSSAETFSFLGQFAEAHKILKDVYPSYEKLMQLINQPTAIVLSWSYKLMAAWCENELGNLHIKQIMQILLKYIDKFNNEYSQDIIEKLVFEQYAALPFYMLQNKSKEITEPNNGFAAENIMLLGIFEIQLLEYYQAIKEVLYAKSEAYFMKAYYYNIYIDALDQFPKKNMLYFLEEGKFVTANIANHEPDFNTISFFEGNEFIKAFETTVYIAVSHDIGLAKNIFQKYHSLITNFISVHNASEIQKEIEEISKIIQVHNRLSNQLFPKNQGKFQKISFWKKWFRR